MSAVALPHVPSARAPSSASSTRRSVHSAGSTASHVSAKSLGQSYGEEEDEEEEDQEEVEEPHESSHGSGSGGLWDEVETFLNKPSPSFAALAKDSNKATSAGGTRVLPTLRNAERSKQPVAPLSHTVGNQSGPRASRPTARLVAKQESTKVIDPKLLQEAFAYAERLQRVNFDDDDDDERATDQQHEAERRNVGMLRRDASFGSTSCTSGPRMPHDAALSKQGCGRKTGDDPSKKKKSGKTSSSAYGASAKPQVAKKKLSVDRRASKDSGGWDASPSSADPNGDGSVQSRKESASMDQQTIQALVSSLQNGTTLDELRRELAASQQSMAASRQVIQDAAKSFFRK